MKGRWPDGPLSAGFFRRGGGPLILLAALLLAACFFLSCASGSAGRAREGGGAQPEIPAESFEEGGLGGLSPESPGAGELPDGPGAVPALEEPAGIPWPGDLEEPVFDFPEAALEPPAPPEAPLAALPEPPAPVFPEPRPEPAEEDAGGAGVPVPAPAAPVPAAPAPVPAPAAPPPAGSVPPAPAAPAPPPPFIRPAEEYRAPPVREAPPPPPVPNPPARTSPAETPESGILYSRVVRATAGQLVEIPFRGTGWVYLGELASRPGIVYGSRRLDPEGQSFIFRAEAPGTYGLKFYRQDFIRDYILNDYVQVIVGEPPEAAVMGWFNPAVDRGRVIAEPRWPSALEEADAPGRSPGTRQTAPGGTGGAQGTAAAPGGVGGAQGAAVTPGGTGGAQGTAVTPGEASGTQGDVPASGEGLISPPPAVAAQTPEAAERDAGGGDQQPGDYLERARREFEAGRTAAAVSILDQFRERYPSGSDEAWWLYGQFYEANSPSRDIRSALDYYRRLLREYPQSPRCSEARRRISYLERYYINIR